MVGLKLTHFRKRLPDMIYIGMPVSHKEVNLTNVQKALYQDDNIHSVYIINSCHNLILKYYAKQMHFNSFLNSYIKIRIELANSEMSSTVKITNRTWHSWNITAPTHVSYHRPLDCLFNTLLAHADNKGHTKGPHYLPDFREPTSAVYTYIHMGYIWACNTASVSM